MKSWARRLGRRHGELPTLELVGAVVNRAALELGVPGPLAPVGAAATARIGREPAPPGGWGDPWLAGVVHEQAAPADERRARGAWYTPQPVVEGLVALACAAGTAGGDTAPGLVLDPTCGGGAFLLAGLDRLVSLGLTPAEAAGRVAGMDLDGDAITVTGWALQLWWAARMPGSKPPPFDLVVGDALGSWPDRWRRPALVVGNPPFATPLRTGAIPEPAARFRLDRAEVLGPYADLAAIHLLRAVEEAAQGSTVALVQPQSTLAGRDTEGLRMVLSSRAPLRALWAAREPLFDAGVRACAVVLAVGAPIGPGAGGTVVLADGPAVRVGRVQESGPWGALGADALGAPELPVMGAAGRLGDLATATAGFRDEHYALVAACRSLDGDGGADSGRSDADRSEAARLVTVGAVEPLWTRWGSGTIRFGGSDRERPVIDRAALPPRIRAWLDRQLRPKVLLATQSRVLEPYVDRLGVVAPATPLIAIHAGPEDLDRVAAVLLAPPVTAWAWRRWFGTAMAIDSVKLAARQVAELPLPADGERWAEAASVVAGADGVDEAEARAVAIEVARLMTEAYGASSLVFDWWLGRLRARS